MFKSTVNFILMNCVMALLPSVGFAQITYDLQTDWSNASNPNGVWSFRQGTSVMTSGTWSSDFTSQPAWLGGFPAVWMQVQSTAGFDVQVGDIVNHSSNGSSPLVNAIWTSPFAGTIDINGGVWMIRDIGRSNTWNLRLNGNLLSSGNLFSGDPYNRANPFNLDSGTGGALDNIMVGAGDVIELSFQQTSTSTNGDYNGVNFSVSLSIVPEPSAIMLAGLSGVGIFMAAKRKRTRGRSLNGKRILH